MKKKQNDEKHIDICLYVVCLLLDTSWKFGDLTITERV